MEKLEVICNTLPLNRICELAAYKGTELIIHRCKNKQEIEYGIYTATDKSVVLLHEKMEKSEPYTSWEIASLRDIRKIPVVLFLSREHYGTEYMMTLYAAGIVDAVYEEDVVAENITERLLSRRPRKECREYYGIQSLEEVAAVLDVIAQETLERYIRYISSGMDKEDILMRYQEVAKKLSDVENYSLANNLPDYIITEIKGDIKFLPKTKKEKEKVMDSFITGITGRRRIKNR